MKCAKSTLVVCCLGSFDNITDNRFPLLHFWPVCKLSGYSMGNAYARQLLNDVIMDGGVGINYNLFMGNSSDIFPCVE